MIDLTSTSTQTGLRQIIWVKLNESLWLNMTVTVIVVLCIVLSLHSTTRFQREIQRLRKELDESHPR